MAVKKMYINGVEINAKLITDLTALTAVDVKDTTKKSIPVADEDSPNDEAKRMLLSELANILTDGYGVKVYEALLTQTGTNAPVATVLKNTLGEVPTFQYDGDGAYECITTGKFTIGKTCPNFELGYDDLGTYTGRSQANTSINAVYIWAFNTESGVGVNDIFGAYSYLHIKVYP